MKSLGELQLTMPLYDGGSNQARRDEQDWRRRGLTNERENTIRQHRNVSETTRRNIERARDSIQSNEEKISALNDRLAEALARQGETSGDVLSITSVQEQLVSIHSEQIALSHQVELGLLQEYSLPMPLATCLICPMEVRNAEIQIHATKRR